MQPRSLVPVAVCALLLPVPAALAATSVVNNNVRIFEDTLWLIVFTLMTVAGLLLKGVSGGSGRNGFLLLALAGVSGWLWKGIGLVKRVFVLNEPVWLFSLARETFEGLTGIILAVAFLLIVYSVVKVLQRQKSA